MCELTHRTAHRAPGSTLSTLQTNDCFTPRLPHRKREFSDLFHNPCLMSYLGRKTVRRFIGVHLSAGITHSCTNPGLFPGDTPNDAYQRGTRTRSFLRMVHSLCKSSSSMRRMVPSFISSEVHCALRSSRATCTLIGGSRCPRVSRCCARVRINR